MATSAYLDSIGHGIESVQYEQNTINRLHAGAARVQKKAFTTWINFYLKPCNMEVTNLYTDLSDGKRLMKLLEVISNAKLGRPNMGVLRVQKIENVGRALEFIKTKVHLENIGAEDIVDGNPTLILGLIWTIILRFQIEEAMLQIEPQLNGSQRSAKEALLLWCQNKTRGYANVDVKDFTTSWRDGLAFGALLHSHDPEAIDMSKMRLDKPMENLTIAFKTAEQCFEVPQMLDPQDVNVPKPDERSVMTYVASMYQMLNKHRNKNKNANRVGKTINQAIDLRSKINWYEVGIRSLLQWIRDKTAFFRKSVQSLPVNLDEVKMALFNFTQYRRAEKSQKYEEWIELQEVLFSISLLTKELRARPYTQTDPQLKIAAIGKAWEELENAESDFEEAIRKAYLRLEKYERMVRQFEHKAAIREGWLTDMEDQAEWLQKLPGTQAGAAKKAEALKLKIESNEKRFKNLDDLALKIIKYGEYPQGSSVQQRNAALQSRWSALSGAKMRALLARIAFPQTRADLMEQLKIVTSKIQELEKQLTQPTKGETEARKSDDKTLPLEVIQAALDRHRIAEAEFLPLERKIYQIRNTAEAMWTNAAPMPNADVEKASDFQECQAAVQLWNRVADESRKRKAKLEGINSTYGLFVSLANELNWVTGKKDFLASTVGVTKDPRNARDLQLAQRLCKKHQAMESEVAAHEPSWDDLKRLAESFLNVRTGGSNVAEDPLADTRQSARSQIAAITSAWSQFREEMKIRENALNECLESAQFYADADEASRWIREKIYLVEAAGILSHPVESEQELNEAIKMCGVDSSSTMAQKRRLTNLETEMQAFQSNDMQRLKYFSTILRNPMDARPLRTELLVPNDADGSSDIDSDVETSVSGSYAFPKNIEGRAQATGRYTAKDPAGRDIDLEEGEMVLVVACTNADWWHVRKNVRGQQKEGFVPANRLRLLQAPVAGRQGSKADALKAVKREVSRGLTIRKAPSARSSNELHFDRENIQKCEQKVNAELSQLQKCVKARDNCLEDTLAWHDFTMKSNNFETWMKQKIDQLQRDSRNMKSHGPSSTHTETTIEEISKGTSLLAEINELADILTGVVKPSERLLYKRGSGELFYKKPVERRMKDIRIQWDTLNKRKTSLEASLTSSSGLGQFEKLAETMEILLGDRTAQLETMPNTASNAETNTELLRRVKEIKVEKPLLGEKMSRLRSMSNSVAQTYPDDAPAVKSRLQAIERLWYRLQDLLKRREEAYSLAAADFSLREKMKNLEGKLNYAEEQIDTLEPTGEIVSSHSLFQSLLPPATLHQRLQKADELDDDLNLYDAAAAELCDEARRLPGSSTSKDKLGSATDALALKNEELKRKLGAKKDNLSSAVKAQNFASALGSIEGNIKELDTRLQMTEPLTSLTDVDREKRRIDGLKIELLKNITAVTVNEERIKAAKLPKDLTNPLLSKSKSIRNAAGIVLKRAEARGNELEKVMAHVNFHNDANDVEEWLEEKKASVQSVPTLATGSSPMENLRQTRARIKKLGDIESELAANQKALDELQNRSHRLSSCVDAKNFPNPQKRVQDLNDRLLDLHKSIGTKVRDLTNAESAAQFNSDADQIIKASVVAPQLAAVPGDLAEKVIRPSQLPRNYAEAVNALNETERNRQKVMGDLAKLDDLEKKAKKAGAWTPELAAQIKQKKETLQKQLDDLDNKEKRNRDLVVWYKTVDEMNMLKDWADDQGGQERGHMRRNASFRTPQEHATQRKSHERLRDEMKRKYPRVQQLLDVKRRPIPACLADDELAKEVRLNLQRSWANLQSVVDARSQQLDDAMSTMNLLSEMADLTKALNAKAADVDRLVNGKSNQNDDLATKKILEVEKYTKETEPKVTNLGNRVSRVLSASSIEPNLAKPLKNGIVELEGSLGDLKDKVNSAKRSLSFQRRINAFDEKVDDQQQGITNALAFISATEIGDDPEQIEKIRNRWQTFITNLPKLVNGVDSCLIEGRRLSDDLDTLINPKMRQAAQTATVPSPTAFGLTINQMATQPQSTYPFCNEQSVRAGADQVRSQVECLARDKGLLQEQVRLVQSRIDRTGDISHFSQAWADLMELIRNRSAHLTALSAVTPKSTSTLAAQVKKHEALETEFVSIQQQVDDVISKGQELLSILRESKPHGGRRNSKTETLISDRSQRLLDALKDLEAKMVDRRKQLNHWSRYLQFSEKVRDVLFWCNEAEQEIVTIEPIAKTAAEAFAMMDQKFSTGQANNNSRVPESIDCSQAELLQANCFRMSDELQQRWKPISIQLVAEAESMIDANHFAASDLKNKVDQMVIAQRSIEDGLKNYNRWILQLLDLLLLKREISKFSSQTVIQRARIDAIMEECSSVQTAPKYASCNKLHSSLDVKSMIQRTENIVKVMKANDDKVASLVSSANLMIQKKHYASTQIHEVINRMQIARVSVGQICADHLESLNRRLEQVVWEEDASDTEAWLTERESELNIMMTPKALHRSQSISKRSSFIEEVAAVRTQLEMLQRQDKFQTSILGNKDHIDEILTRGAKLVEVEGKIPAREGSTNGQDINSRCTNISRRWKKLRDSLASSSSALEASRDLSRYQNEADALEGWLREKDILLAKGDFGSDYDHCVSLKDKISEPAAGKIVNDATIRDFRSLSDRILQSLRKSPMGTHNSIVVLNKQTSDYVDGRTADICDRWSRVQESLSRYAKLLELAATIHEVISKVDGLLIQISNRKSKASVRDDLGKMLTVSELEALLRELQTNERDVAAIEAQTKKVEEEAKNAVESFASNVPKTQTSALIQQINSKMSYLEAVTRETKVLQKERRELLESKLAAQRILEGCRQLVDWSNGVEKELKPHIVGTAMVGLVGKLAMLKVGKSATTDGESGEKRRAFIVRMRRRLTDCQSELPLRQQQLTRLQSQAQQLKSETMERKAVPGEIKQADEALKRAADILARLEIQVDIEEKRQAFATTGKQEDRWIESVQSQAQQAVKSAFRGLATDSDNSDDETDQPMIVASTNGIQQYAAPPSEISPQACLAMLDSLASSLEDRNTMKKQFDELQQCHTTSKEAKEIYTPDKVKEDKQLLDKTQARALMISQMIAKMREQVETRTECDNWFVSANESLKWMKENQSLAAITYDWRVVLKRFGENVPGSENDQTCGPKGSNGMARKMAAHRRFNVDIDIGLEMVDRLCEQGEQLVRLNPKKATKVSQMVGQLQAAATQLRSTCAERALRLNEANELVKWGQLMDEALEAAKHAEAQLMSDDYHRGENGLKRLLDKHEVIARDIQETQRARAKSLLKTATEAEKKGHFAGARMVNEAKELTNTVEVTLPQLAQARLDAIQLMITWRRLEKDLRVENDWLKEQLNSPLLDIQSSALQNLDQNTATRQLKSLSELASCLAAQSPKIDEIVEKVNKLTNDDSRKTKSLLSDLGTLQEASHLANQLMNQKSELESRVGAVGTCLITEHMYLQHVHDIQEAQEWIKAHLYPVSKLAPMTDSSGTKAALQNVSRLRDDVSAFRRSTIGQLSARLQQRSFTDDANVNNFVPPEERTQAIVSDDLRKLVEKHQGSTKNPNQKDMQANLNREMANLLTNFDVLSAYLELIEVRLKLRIKINAYNTQGDEFNQFLSSFDADIESRDYGVDLDECETLLAKFTERMESTSNSGTSHLTNLTNRAKQLTETADDLMGKVDTEEQRVKKSRMQESDGWTSVPQELLNLRSDVQLDMKTVQERQVELTQRWASVRTCMKRRRENLQSAMRIHVYMSDVDDLLEWIVDKSPEARDNKKSAALLGRISSLKATRPEINPQTSTGLERALNEQEKLRREVNAMKKQVEKQEQECDRLKQDCPDRAPEVEKQWKRLETAWNSLQIAVGGERQRLSEAQKVTQWQSRCDLLCGWADKQRLAMLAVQEIPIDLSEAHSLLDTHRQIRLQITKRTPEREEIIRAGQDLSNSIPSSKIVIQKSTEKLETAWSQMQSLWGSRNSLYEKNLDLRKLYEEMAELDAWLDEQEQRLERTTNIITGDTSAINVDQAIANHADIEKAVEDAKQRFDAIKRQTQVETLKFEFLKFMTKRNEGSRVGDQPFSNARIAEIQRRETSKLNRNRSSSKHPTSTVNPAEQVNQEHLQAIFGSLAPIEANVEQSVQHAAPPMPVIPPASSQNDSFGMTNAHFVRRGSDSSDIDSLPVSRVVDIKPTMPPREHRSPLLRSPSQKSNSKLINLFRQSTNESIASSASAVTPTITSPEPRVGTPQRWGSKIFSKRRGNETLDSPAPSTTETPKMERVVSISSSLSPVPTRVISKPPPLVLDAKSSVQADYNSRSAASTRERATDLPPKAPNSTAFRESDIWSPGDLSSTPVNEMKLNLTSDHSGAASANRPPSVSLRQGENSPKASLTGSLARKIVAAPKSYRGITKKWLPHEQTAGYNWAVLEGSRLSFYENEGAPTIGTAPLAVFNVQGAVVSHCLPKTSKTHAHVMQMKLEDGTEILLAANTLDNYNRWYDCLRSASCLTPIIISPDIENMWMQSE
ncbi:Spectrin beta chain, non-erythrocytic 1 [Echinococcus granulosus]|nr:Spectrin beta chain, non-erythrocytic 1 [Echinococcus granulosus]